MRSGTSERKDKSNTKILDSIKQILTEYDTGNILASNRRLNPTLVPENVDTQSSLQSSKAPSTI